MFFMNVNFELLMQGDDGQWDVIDTGSLENIAALRRDNQFSDPAGNYHIRQVRKN